MSKEDNKTKGDKGEDYACQYLLQKGYRILKRNFRCRFGEIDIMARDGESLVFIEVKTKTSDEYGYPEEMVDDAKIKKIEGVMDYVAGSLPPKKDFVLRIDVVAVELDDMGMLQDLRHIVNFT